MTTVQYTHSHTTFRFRVSGLRTPGSAACREGGNEGGEQEQRTTRSRQSPIVVLGAMVRLRARAPLLALICCRISSVSLGLDDLRAGSAILRLGLLFFLVAVVIVAVAVAVVVVGQADRALHDAHS